MDKIEMAKNIIDYVLVDVDDSPTPEQLINYIEKGG